MKRFITNVRKTKAEKIIKRLGLTGFYLLEPVYTDTYNSTQLEKFGMAGLYVNSNIHNLSSFFNEYNQENRGVY